MPRKWYCWEPTSSFLKLVRPMNFSVKPPGARAKRDSARYAETMRGKIAKQSVQRFRRLLQRHGLDPTTFK